MRPRGHLWPLLVFCLTSVFPSTAAADPISIISGVVEMGPGTPPFSLVGDRRGFQLRGTSYQGGLSPSAFVFCPDDLCLPGGSAEFRHAASGLDLPATATLDGITYEDVGSLSSPASASMGFESAFVLPPGSPNAATLRVPFAMEGSFALTGVETIALRGAGTLTTTWLLSSAGPSGPSVWSLASARYDFEQAAPIPEPSTLLLSAAGGLVALCRKRRLRAR